MITVRTIKILTARAGGKLVDITYCWLYVCAFFVFLATDLHAQKTSTGEPIHVVADSLANETKNGEAVTNLIRNFSFYQGSMTGTAERAVQYPARNAVELFGNVVIHQDTLTLKAPHVTYDGATRTATADGNIDFSDRDDHVTSARGTYDMNNAIANFYEHVKAISGGTVLTSNALQYTRGTQTMVAHGDVTVLSDSGSIHCDSIIDAKVIGERTAFGRVSMRNDSLIIFCHWLYESKPSNSLITTGEVQAYSIPNMSLQYGDTIIRNTQTGYTIIPSRPLLLMIDTSMTVDSVSGENVLKYDTLFVRSKKMEAFPNDSGKFVATDSVILTRAGFSGMCGKLVYYRDKGLMTMSAAKRQHVWFDSTEINGDSVVLFERDNKPYQIVSIGHAFATTPYTDSGGAGRISQLSSQSMILTIVHDSVRTLLAVDNALSIYFLTSDKKPDGLNHASGDSLRIDFEKNSPKRIVVISGVVGETFPERYMTGRAAAYRLGNYERYYDILHPKKEDFLPDWIPLPIIP